MDDLTRIKGIGNVTAARLAGAGFDGYAALAAATPEQLQAIDRLPGSPADWSDWVNQAKALMPAPVDLGTATPDEIQLQAARIDAARAKIVAAGEAVAAAAASGDAQAIEAARLAALAATAELDGLIGPGTESQEGTPAGLDREDQADEPAGQTAGAASQSAAPVTPPAEPEGTHSTHNPQREQSDDQEGGEVGNPADLAAAEEALIQREISRVIASVRDIAQTDPALAVAHLDVEIATAQRIVEAGRHVMEAFQAERVQLSRTETVWPLTTVRMDGVEQPIGEPLKVDRDTFLALTGSGAAADHPPQTDIEGVSE